MFISKSRLDGDNVELDALRALQYEGSPAEIAHGFKEQGNEVVKMKQWKDGKEYYTKGLAVLTQRKKLRSLKSLDEVEGEQAIVEDEVEIGKQRGLEEACYVNRALCNLELSILSNPCTVAKADMGLISAQRIIDPRPSTARRPSASTPKMSKHITAPPLLSLLLTSSPKLRTPAPGGCRLIRRTPP